MNTEDDSPQTPSGVRSRNRSLLLWTCVCCCVALMVATFGGVFFFLSGLSSQVSLFESTVFGDPDKWANLMVGGQPVFVFAKNLGVVVGIVTFCAQAGVLMGLIVTVMGLVVAGRTRRLAAS